MAWIDGRKFHAEFWSWHHVKTDCVPAWQDWDTFRTWREQAGDGELYRADPTKPHGPENTRVGTPSQRCLHKRTHSNNTTGHKGVYAHRGRWRARIMVEGSMKDLGVHDDFDSAVEARRRAERKYLEAA